jgi:hypothetical protein
MDVADTGGWLLEKWPVLLDWVGGESLYYWPELPEEIEPEVYGGRTVERWMQVLSRDAYRYGTFLLKFPQAWMYYRASVIWSRESECRPEDFIVPDDPEGTISQSRAQKLSGQKRAAARVKLAWLGTHFASKVEAHDYDFFEALARIAERLPSDPPPDEFDPETGGFRIWVRCLSQECLVVNSIYSMAGRNATATYSLLPNGVSSNGPEAVQIAGSPTCRQVFEFLKSNGTIVSESDIRKIAKRFGLAFGPGPRGRPKLGSEKNAGRKRRNSVP